MKTITVTDLSIDQVIHLSHLARLILTKKEISIYTKQLAESIAYMNNLNEIDTSTISDDFYTTNARNVMSQDNLDTHRLLSQKQALQNAHKTQNGSFVVERILK